MSSRWRWLVSAVAVISVTLLLASGFAMATSSGMGKGAGLTSSVLSKPRVKDLCSVPTNEATGLYPLSKTTAYLENYSSGSISVCGSGVDTQIAAPPSGYSGSGYDGMAGLKVSGKLDLILISWQLDAGYYCLGASASGCASTAGFSLPPSFCTAQPIGSCHPNGLILSKTLGFTYVDSGNVEMVTCTAYAPSCTVDAASNYFSGFEPVGIVLVGLTLYVSDLSCTGWIWSGTTTTMSRVTNIGDSLEGIAYHGGNLYVGDNGACTSSKAHVVDVTTNTALPTPFKSPDEYIGLDADLQFDSYDTGGVYSV